jgi:hypothetical protein
VLPPGRGVRSSPGRAFANAINSFTVFAGTEGCTTSTLGLVANGAIAAKSFTRSYASFGYSVTLIVCVVEHMSSV